MRWAASRAAHAPARDRAMTLYHHRLSRIATMPTPPSGRDADARCVRWMSERNIARQRLADCFGGPNVGVRPFDVGSSPFPRLYNLHWADRCVVNFTHAFYGSRPCVTRVKLQSWAMMPSNSRWLAGLAKCRGSTSSHSQQS
jgi:hypothetical protein